MLILLESGQVRGQYAPNRPLVRGAVGVSAHAPIHGTSIQARTTANAVQHLALLRVGQQTTAAIVHQNHVELVWPVCFPSLARTPNKGSVGGNGLARTRGRQNRPEQGQVLKPWQNIVVSCPD